MNTVANPSNLNPAPYETPVEYMISLDPCAIFFYMQHIFHAKVNHHLFYLKQSFHLFIHNPQLPLSPTLPQYPLRARPALLPAVLAQMPAFDLLLAGVEDALVVGLLLGAGVEATIDAGIEGAAEGFAYALFFVG